MGSEVFGSHWIHGRKGWHFDNDRRVDEQMPAKRPRCDSRPMLRSSCSNLVEYVAEASVDDGIVDEATVRCHCAATLWMNVLQTLSHLE